MWNGVVRISSPMGSPAQRCFFAPQASPTGRPSHYVSKTLRLPCDRQREKVALDDILARQIRQAGFDERAAQTLFAVGFGHGEMMQIAAPAIVSAQDRADDLVAADRDPAQTGIPVQEGGDAFAGVGFIEAHAFGGLPELQHGVVIGRGHGAQFGVHKLQAVTKPILAVFDCGST